MKRRLLTIVLALAAMAGTALGQAPKRELRSTWLATVWAIDWPASHNEASAKAQMQRYLDELAANNFNGICFQVRGMADAMYRSSYEPWNSVLTGTRGKDPGWDPLEWVTEQCHRRGLECYAWVNPYRESSSGNLQNTDIDRKWQADGLLLSNGSYIVFNPGLPEARAHILKVIKEIYNNYAIDGILFDDYFYPSGGTVENASAPDYDLYKASGTKLSMADWRRKNINDFMKEIYDNIQLDRPDMRFGLSPAGVAGKSASIYGTPGVPVPSGDWQYDQIYSDPLAWLHDGAVDFISPQLYWKTDHATAPFGPLTNWWSQVANKFGRHFYASHSISLLTNDNSQANWDDIARQVTLHRQSQAVYRAEPGAIYYSAKNLDGIGSGGVAGLGKSLASSVYTTKSLVPRLTWKDRPVYSAPADARLEGSTLKWTAATPARDKAIVRYSVYAIPSTMAYERALDLSGDGIDARYLVGVSYQPSMELPADLTRSHYYAVCVYDGYGYESEAALINYNSEPSQAATLLTPADGSAISDWNVSFSWQGVAGASYDLEIASDASFTRPVETRTALSESAVTIDLSRLRGNTTYFWRVFTMEPDRISSSSPVFSFVTPERPVGNYEEGYDIVTDVDSYPAVGGFELTSLWHRSILPQYNNFTPVSDKGVLNRGMVATAEYVYVTGRSQASQDADLYLQVYNSLTGEHERDLALSTDGRCPYLPCNDIIKDSNDNLCITNLSLNIATTPLQLYMVDTQSGDLELVASVTAAAGGRIDHCGVYGDVASGEFTIFAAAAGTTRVYRWIVSGGVAASAQAVEIKEFNPGWSTDLGIAPKVYPTADSEFYLDGGATAAALYSFDSGRIIDAPAPTGAHYTEDMASNGMDYFTMGGHNFVVYASASHEGGGFKFSIVSSATAKPLATGDLMWRVPASTLGNSNSTTFSAPVSTVFNSGDNVNIYIYVPGNGLSAYTLSKHSGSVTDIAAAQPRMSVYGRVVVFDHPQDFIKIYSLTGALVAAESSATEAAVPAPGNYIVVTPAGAAKVVLR